MSNQRYTLLAAIVLIIEEYLQINKDEALNIVIRHLSGQSPEIIVNKYAT